MGSIVRDLLASSVVMLKNTLFSIIVFLASEFTIDEVKFGILLSNSIKVLLVANLIFKLIREIIKIVKK